MSSYHGRRIGRDHAFGRHRFSGVQGQHAVRGRCRRRRRVSPYMNGGYPQHSAYGGGYGGYDGQGVDDYDNSRGNGYGGSAYGGNQGGYGQGVDDYDNSNDGGYGGSAYGGDQDGYGQDQGYGHGVDDYNSNGGGYGGGHGGYGHGGGYGGASSKKQSNYARHQHSENVNDSSSSRHGPHGGQSSSNTHHADESYLDETGHKMSETDQYGQHAAEQDDSIDAGNRQANSQNTHIRRPDGSIVDDSSRDGSVNTMSQDDQSRTFNGPNGSASESNHDFSENSDQFSSSNQRIVN